MGKLFRRFAKNSAPSGRRFVLPGGFLWTRGFGGRIFRRLNSLFFFWHLLNADKSDVIAQVLEEMPPDPTNLEDMIHAALFTGDPMKALEHAAKLDPWLSAHLADMMEPLALVDKEPNDE